MDIFENMGLKGKSVVITGGLGLIGAEVAEWFLRLGSKVHILDIANSDRISKLTESESNNYKFYNCDVSDISEVDKAIKMIIEDSLKIDVLFNNAATKGSNPKNFNVSGDKIIETKVFREVMSVNVEGMFNVTATVSEYMKREESGSIIHTSSIYAADMGVDQRIYNRHNLSNFQQMGSPAVYSASKSAVIGLTKYFAGYLGKYNIRVNSISPGGVYNNHSKDFVEDYSLRVPMGRMAQKHEIAGPVVFLASELSTYVNGLNLYIDGGLHAW